MRRETFYHILLFSLIYSTIFIYIWPGIGLELPKSYSTTTESDDFEYFLYNGETERKIIDLGELSAWSIVEITVASSDDFGMEITSSDPESSQPRGNSDGDLEQRLWHTDHWYLVILVNGPETRFDSDGFPIRSAAEISGTVTIIIEQSDTIDLRLVSIITLALLGFIYYLRNSSKFHQWEGPDPRETKRLQLINKNNHCNYCGYDKISPGISGWAAQYCSFTCQNVAQRSLWLILSYGLLIFVIISPWWFILSIPLTVFALFYFDKHRPKFMYRRVQIYENKKSQLNNNEIE